MPGPVSIGHHAATQGPYKCQNRGYTSLRCHNGRSRPLHTDFLASPVDAHHRLALTKFWFEYCKMVTPEPRHGALWCLIAEDRQTAERQVAHAYNPSSRVRQNRWRAPQWDARWRKPRLDRSPGRLGVPGDPLQNPPRRAFPRRWPSATLRERLWDVLGEVYEVVELEK